MTYKAKDLRILSVETASGEARHLLQRAQTQMGFVPNMYGAMANEPALLAAYSDAYEAFRAKAGFTPAEQEVIFLTISRENGCEYCVAAHSLVADAMSGVPAEIIESIRSRLPVKDERLGALSTFTATMTLSRGNLSDTDVEAFLKAGYSERQIMGVILAISVKTLSNYTNHLFHTPLDAAFAQRAWRKSL